MLADAESGKKKVQVWIMQNLRIAINKVKIKI